MRRVILALSFLAILIVIVGADFRRTESTNVSSTEKVIIHKKKCVGFTIIEFGKGIDCNGDTVKLVRKNGVQVLAGL
jgi:hypothetical protein